MIHRLLIDVKSIKGFKKQAYSKYFRLFIHDFEQTLIYLKYKLRFCELAFLWARVPKMAAFMTILNFLLYQKGH